MKCPRARLSAPVSLLTALALAACGQVGTNTLAGGGDTSAASPAITQQPASQSVVAGQTANFSVVATGSAPLTYQWRKNGVSIDGAVSDSYSAAADPADDGAVFSVVVSNPVGAIESDAAKLTVTTAAVAPAITSQPADQSITAGQSATFSVTATGSVPLSYQWQKNGAAIAGATAASYTTPSETTSDDGALFAVVVSNSVGSITSRSARLGVSAASGGPVAPSITTQPADQSISAGQTATFSVTAAGSTPLSYQWRKNGAAIAGASGASYTTPAESTSDNGANFSVLVSNAAGSIASRNAVLTVTTGTASAGADILTYKYDVARTGQNLKEKLLTPANVKSSTFGKLRFLNTDGKVEAQPLYLSALTVNGASRNVVFVATENDSVYAFDADSGAQLWVTSLIPAGETAAIYPACTSVTPTIGITSTPVIDRSAGPHGTMFVVTMTQAGTTYHHRLHALDVATGAELLGPTTIAATFPASGGAITFDSSWANERAALLLANGVIYTAWTSQCDSFPYSGWLIAYSKTSLQQTAVLNVGPNSGNQGPAIWMAGGGLAADSANNVYLITANGGFEQTLDANGFPNMGDFGNSFLRLSTAGGALTVADYFSPSETVGLSSLDLDLGSGGILLLPDQTDAAGTTRHLAVGAGKDGNIYVVNRDSMGHFSRTANNIWQLLPSILGNLGTNSTGFGGVWSTPAYFNGHVYYGAVGDSVKSFSFSSAQLSAAPVASSTVKFSYPGAAPSVSANGTANAIVWAHETANPGVLYAFDATTLALLYSSAQAAGGRDQFGAGNKFITPVVADGKVFVGTTTGVAVFGLLP